MPMHILNGSSKLTRSSVSTTFLKRRKSRWHLLSLDYDNVWWEDYQRNREKLEEPLVTTGTKMKNVMYARFVPEHYRQDLFDKLQNLKQGTKTIEEFYKETEMTHESHVKDLEEQTKARFLN